MDVMKVVKEMEQSQGFVMFVAFVVPRPGQTPGLEFRYMRQQYPLEDMKKAHEEFKGLMTKDMSESGYNLLKDAEKIVTEAQLNDGPIGSPGT